MPSNPLAVPQSPELLQRFEARFRLESGCDPRDIRARLGGLARAFSHLPYENLTKIIKEAEAGRPQEARRDPGEVIDENVRLGTGGTCFSLTAALLFLVRSLGCRAEPILADRRYGANTHCALLVWLEDRAHLVDPGYLIVDPVLLPSDRPLTVRTRFNRITLVPRDNGSRIDLCTPQPGRSDPDSGRCRLTFKTDPADPGEFLAAWDSSFDWEMMRYPVLSRVGDRGQLFLCGNRFQVRSHDGLCRTEISTEDLVRTIAAEFGIHQSVASRALSILRAKGEL